MRALTRPVLMAIAAAALMVATSSELFASPIFFDFSGACHSVQGDGCAAFGLSDGSNVSGTFMFDDSVVLPNTRLILYPSSISFSFAFTFGNFAVTDADVRGSFGSPLEVFFLGPDATELNALSGFIPFQVLTDGSKYLLLQPFHRVEVDQVFAVTRDVALKSAS